MFALSLYSVRTQGISLARNCGISGFRFLHSFLIPLQHLCDLEPKTFPRLVRLTRNMCPSMVNISLSYGIVELKFELPEHPCQSDMQLGVGKTEERQTISTLDLPGLRT